MTQKLSLSFYFVKTHRTVDYSAHPHRSCFSDLLTTLFLSYGFLFNVTLNSTEVPTEAHSAAPDLLQMQRKAKRYTICISFIHFTPFLFTLPFLICPGLHLSFSQWHDIIVFHLWSTFKFPSPGQLFRQFFQILNLCRWSGLSVLCSLYLSNCISVCFRLLSQFVKILLNSNHGHQYSAFYPSVDTFWGRYFI